MKIEPEWAPEMRQNIGNPYQMEDNKTQGGRRRRRRLVVFHLVRIFYVFGAFPGPCWISTGPPAPCGNHGFFLIFLIHTVTTPTLASTGMTPILDQPLRARAYRRQAQARESGSGQGYTQPTTHETPWPPMRARLGQPIPSPFVQTLQLRGRTHLPAS